MDEEVSMNEDNDIEITTILIDRLLNDSFKLGQ